jgi:hypothetical protein
LNCIKNGSSATAGTIGFTAVNNVFDQCFGQCVQLYNTSRCIVANNTADLTPTITQSSGQPAFYIYSVTDASFIGNSIANCYYNGFLSDMMITVPTTNIVITGNTFYNVLPVIPGGSSIGITTGNASLEIASQPATNFVITGNSFRGTGRPILCLAEQSIISGNTYNGSTVANVISSSNIISDDNFTLPIVTIRNNVNYQEDVLGATVIGSQTNNGSAVTYLSYSAIGITESWRTQTIQQYGFDIISIEAAVGFTGSTLPGCTLSILTSDANAISYYTLYTQTVTVPQTSNPLTDPRLVTTLSTPLFVPPGLYKFTITPPAGQTLNSRYANIAPSQAQLSNSPTTSAIDFVVNIQIVTPTQFMSIGNQGNNKGQLVVGPSGTPLSQIKTYAITGTFPTVNANSEAIVAGVTATGVQTTDVLFITTLGAIPAGLNIGGIYSNATNQVTFKIMNFTTSTYNSGGTYNFTAVGITTT